MTTDPLLKYREQQASFELYALVYWSLKPKHRDGQMYGRLNIKLI
jgi:hypothetical protein